MRYFSSMTQGEWVQGPQGWYWVERKPKNQAPKMVALVVGIVIAVVAGIFITKAVTSRPFTAEGTLLLDHGCYTGGSGYGDIVRGTQVTVTAGGQTVALGALGSGTSIGDIRDGMCTFPLAIPNVPGGHDFYLVEVSHRGGISYTEEEMRSGVHVTLG